MPSSSARLLSRRSLLQAAAAVSVAPFGTGAHAQSWPARAVRVIVPFPAGGATDLLARMLSTRLSETLGQAFVVDNRAGANGNLGTGAVAAAAPDGLTLLFAPTGPLVYNPFLYKGLTFDPAKDLVPIVKAAEIPLLIAAHPTVPVNNLAELVKYAKAHPDDLTYSSAGNGSMGHLTAELIQRELGIRLTHVPYKGSAPALSDLLAGVVKLSFDLAPTYAQYVQSGKVKALAVTTARRTALMPNVATVAEQAIRGFEVTNWSGFAAPAGVPADVVTRVNQVVNTFITSEAGRREIEALGMQPAGGTPQEMARFMKAQVAIWEPIARSVVIN